MKGAAGYKGGVSSPLLFSSSVSEGALRRDGAEKLNCELSLGSAPAPSGGSTCGCCLCAPWLCPGKGFKSSAKCPWLLPLL